MDNYITLSPEQHAKVVEAIRTLDQMLPVFEHLEACGENCQLRRTKATNLRNKLQEMDNRFGNRK